jgi:hypothetical protein
LQRHSPHPDLESAILAMAAVIVIMSPLEGSVLPVGGSEDSADVRVSGEQLRTKAVRRPVRPSKYRCRESIGLWNSASGTREEAMAIAAEAAGGTALGAD